MSTAEPAQVPDFLEGLRAQIKGAAMVWPDYLLALGSLTLGLSIAGNGWIFIRGVTSAPLRGSVYHVILINLFLVALLHSLTVFPGFTHMLRSGMGETGFIRAFTTIGITLHFWFMTVTMSLQTLLAINRAMASVPGWKSSQIVCSKKFTCGALVVIWVVCLIIFLIMATKYTDSYQGAFNCMIVDDYIDNILANKEMRPMQPALRMVRDIMTSFLSVDIIVSVFAYVIVIYGQGKQSQANQGDLWRTTLISVLMLMEWMAFWIPHTVAFLFDQSLLLGNYAYMYLPMMGLMVAPVFYMLAMPEYRPPFLSGSNNNTVTTMPSNSKGV